MDHTEPDFLKYVRRKNRNRSVPLAVGGQLVAMSETPTSDASVLHAQCLAFTQDGKQCRNSAREGSKYCAPHAGYKQPRVGAIVALHDTKPRSRRAKDTKPSFRRPR